jgi:hypothetical protein
MASIDHEPLIVRLVNALLQQALPHPGVAPANKAPMGVAPAAIINRQITLWGTGTQHPDYSIDKSTVVLNYPAPYASAHRQVRFEQLPHRIADVMPPVR